MRSTEDFNLVAGIIFADALESFPRPSNSRDEEILNIVWGEELPPFEYDPGAGRGPDYTQDQSRYLDVVRYTTKWLIDEGYLRAGSAPSGMRQPVILTSKGISALGVRLESVDGSSETVGEKLKRALKTNAYETARAAVTQIIVFGAKQEMDG